MEMEIVDTVDEEEFLIDVVVVHSTNIVGGWRGDINMNDGAHELLDVPCLYRVLD